MRYSIFIISIAVVLSGFALGLRYFLKESRQNITEKSAPSPVPTPSSTGSVHRVQEVPDVAISTVTYSQGKFSPALVNIKSESVGSGCLITIVNTSDRPLTIRLSPHDPKDEWGFLYPVIPAGEKSIIDPRYRIPEIVFHNHEKPDEEFKVILAKGCL